MVNKLFVAPTDEKQKAAKKSLLVGWDSLKFSLHSLLLLIMLSHQVFVLVSSRISQIMFSIVPSSFSIKCGGRQQCLRRLFGLWGISYYLLQIKRLPGPVTERGGNQRPPSMAINATTTLNSFGLLDPPFYSTAHSKYRWQKNIRIREKSVYTAKLSGFKSFRIQSSHFRFRIQNLRRHDQTEMFSFRIRPLACKRQNQPGTKTFRIHHESGTISPSVNLV